MLILAPSRNAVVSGLDLTRVQIYDEAGTSGLTVEWSVDGGSLSPTVTLNPNYRCAGETTTDSCAIYDPKSMIIVKAEQVWTPTCEGVRKLQKKRA